ncbi:uncharacterized protein CMU_002050 [Cryptosporidium muris RN66]|uniref:Spindle pole body component n=1 Tax=Cryptosporidium muris (strain RN66) TaxID=441375 RepID=B6AGJ3_CRYMR|nr:uncharacterized protein CMU_002050 [Cryptosporidium muris RN66]EEA07334.1 hypothetical protein CMU_002050 [Cryptosporidium muris RN66]|eukprot:XP_002141683.1 hypothetical protein [Cryptosporidium muris RN66]
MLHDILLALTGYEGNAIDIQPCEFSYNGIALYSYRYKMTLKKYLSEHLTTTEISLIERILLIASDIYSINKFLEITQSCIYIDSSHINIHQDNCNKNKSIIRRRLVKINPVGLYIQGISKCIQQYMLKYLNCISQLEREIFLSPNLPLSYILSYLTRPSRLITIIMNFIDQWYNLCLVSRPDDTNNPFSFSSISSSKLSVTYNSCNLYISVPMGSILDILYEGSCSGDQLEENVYRNFLLVCSRVFCYQVINWITLGQLVDPFEEFFIGRFSIPNIGGSFEYITTQDNNSNHEINNLMKSTLEGIYMQDIYPSFYLPNDSCIELYGEFSNELENEADIIHGAKFEWEGLFYIRHESLTKKFLKPKLLLKIFGTGKIIRSLIKSRYFTRNKEEFIDKNQLIENLIDALNSSFPHIQDNIENTIEKFREYTSSLLYQSAMNVEGNISKDVNSPISISLIEYCKIIRDKYLLGNEDLYVLLSDGIYEKLGQWFLSELSPREQEEWIETIWRKSVLNINDKDNTSDINIMITCDTFDLFNCNDSIENTIDKEIEYINCLYTDLPSIILLDNKLKLESNVSSNSPINKVLDKSKEIICEVNELSQEQHEKLSLNLNNGSSNNKISYKPTNIYTSICSTKWPVRIIDGFNHLLECISSLDVPISLIFTPNSKVSNFSDLQYNSNKIDNEFLKFTWFIKINIEKNILEFTIKAYWYTKNNLKDILNNNNNEVILKSNKFVFSIPYCFPKEADEKEDKLNLYRDLLLSYKLRIICKKSTFSIFLEPCKIPSKYKHNIVTFINRPTQIMLIQHLNLGICLPLKASSVFIHIMRHINTDKDKQQNYLKKEEKKPQDLQDIKGPIISNDLYKFEIIKWCHISVNNNDIISSILQYIDQLSYLADNKPLNIYYSGISYYNHIFRIRLTQNLKWPLPILFTNKNMEIYYNIFDFLWLLHMTFNSLLKVWTESFNLRYSNRRQGAILAICGKYSYQFTNWNQHWDYIFYSRWILQNIIGEIYRFIHSSVINQCFDDFLNNLEQVRDFEFVRNKHDELIQDLLLKCALLLPSIINPLGTILVLTNEWCHNTIIELSRWNHTFDSDIHIEYSNVNNIQIPWKSEQWFHFINDTYKFMKSFCLIWNDLCSELSVVSQSIQYQHFAYLISSFNYNQWSVIVPFFNNDEPSYLYDKIQMSNSLESNSDERLSWIDDDDDFNDEYSYIDEHYKQEWQYNESLQNEQNIYEYNIENEKFQYSLNNHNSSTNLNTFSNRKYNVSELENTSDISASSSTSLKLSTNLDQDSMDYHLNQMLETRRQLQSFRGRK